MNSQISLSLYYCYRATALPTPLGLEPKTSRSAVSPEAETRPLSANGSSLISPTPSSKRSVTPLSTPRLPSPDLWRPRLISLTMMDLLILSASNVPPSPFSLLDLPSPKPIHLPSLMLKFKELTTSDFPLTASSFSWSLSLVFSPLLDLFLETSNFKYKVSCRVISCQCNNQIFSPGLTIMA